MKLMYNGAKIGNVTTNRSLTVEEALYAIGYDVNDKNDLEKAYEDEFPASYLDDNGYYQIDTENIIMEY